MPTPPIDRFDDVVKAFKKALNALIKELTIQKLNLDVYPHSWSEEELQEFADDLAGLTSGDSSTTVKKLFGELCYRHAEVLKLEEAEKKKAEAEKKKAEAEEAKKKQQAEAIAKAQDMVELMKSFDPATLKVIAQKFAVFLDSNPEPKPEKKKKKNLEQKPASTANPRPPLPG
eukprot:3847211-Rhodomonas_salina.1